MKDNHDSQSPGGEDLLWGALRIGQAMNITERQASYKLESGQLPAKKIGNRWVASKTAILKLLSVDTPEAA